MFKWLVLVSALARLVIALYCLAISRRMTRPPGLA
jgi:hypothetical protein